MIDLLRETTQLSMFAANRQPATLFIKDEGKTLRVQGMRDKESEIFFIVAINEMLPAGEEGPKCSEETCDRIQKSRQHTLDAAWRKMKSMELHRGKI